MSSDGWDDVMHLGCGMPNIQDASWYYSDPYNGVNQDYANQAGFVALDPYGHHFLRGAPPVSALSGGGLSGGSLLARQLAQQFPSARIVIGDPDEEIERAMFPDPEPEPSALDVQMRRLKELLEKDKVKHPVL